MTNWCDTCRGGGLVPDPARRWWQFWRGVRCAACGGDGRAKPPGWPDRAEDEPCVIQSRHVSGPQAHWPDARVRNYRGKVWRLRLWPRNRLDAGQSARLTDFLESCLGDGYDYRDAGISGTRFLRLARWIHPLRSSLFCSEYAMAALKDVGVVDRDLNPAAYNPAPMARDLQWWQTYQSIGPRGSESARLK